MHLRHIICQQHQQCPAGWAAYLRLLMLVWMQAVHKPLVGRLDLLLAGTAWHSKYCIQLLVSICRNVSRAAASSRHQHLLQQCT
jgi:hypothetical protein